MDGGLDGSALRHQNAERVGNRENNLDDDDAITPNRLAEDYLPKDKAPSETEHGHDQLKELAKKLSEREGAGRQLGNVATGVCSFPSRFIDAGENIRHLGGQTEGVIQKNDAGVGKTYGGHYYGRSADDDA